MALFRHVVRSASELRFARKALKVGVGHLWGVDVRSFGLGSLSTAIRDSLTVGNVGRFPCQGGELWLRRRSCGLGWLTPRGCGNAEKKSDKED